MLREELAQRIVNSLGVWKDSSKIGVDQNYVRTLSELPCALASDT